MRDAHTLHMRFGLMLLLAAAFFAVVPSASLAIRFADTPCVESGTDSRVCPAGVVQSPYVVRLNGEGGCGPEGDGIEHACRTPTVAAGIPPMRTVFIPGPVMVPG